MNIPKKKDNLQRGGHNTDRKKGAKRMESAEQRNCASKELGQFLTARGKGNRLRKKESVSVNFRGKVCLRGEEITLWGGKGNL